MDKKIEEMYQENAELVYKYVLCLCHDSFLAEELVQETFYQAMRSIHRYDGTCKLSVWLCQIAKHLWYREAKRRSRFTNMESKEVQDTLFSEKDVEEAICAKESKIELYRKIQNLTSPTREVMYLRLSRQFKFCRNWRNTK